MLVFKKLEALFQEIEAGTGVKKHRIMLEVGIDPAQYRAYKRASRLPSRDMLRRLSEFPDFPVSKERLLAWRAIDAFGVSVILEALRVLEEERIQPSPSLDMPPA